MKHLFIARHGEYGSNKRLNEEGEEQMIRLANSIKSILNNGSVYLASSTAYRALDSSDVLAKELGVSDYEQLPYLRSGTDAMEEEGSFERDPNPEELLRIIDARKDKADGLVLVTHHEIVNGDGRRGIPSLPSYFVKNRTNIQDYSFGEISKGEAPHINLEEQSYQVLPCEV